VFLIFYESASSFFLKSHLRIYLRALEKKSAVRSVIGKVTPWCFFDRQLPTRT
jgi:hypothetical protein